MELSEIKRIDEVLGLVAQRMGVATNNGAWIIIENDIKDNNLEHCKCLICNYEFDISYNNPDDLYVILNHGISHIKHLMVYI